MAKMMMEISIIRVKIRKLMKKKRIMQGITTNWIMKKNISSSIKIKGCRDLEEHIPTIKIR